MGGLVHCASAAACHATSRLPPNTRELHRGGAAAFPAARKACVRALAPAAEAEAAVEAGRAQAYAADATVAAHGRLLRVQGLQPIAVAPYAVAVRRGDNRVAGW